MTSNCLTKGVRVEVSSVYLDDYSNPSASEYLYTYKVVITNEGEESVQLLNRHWIIIDSNSKKEEVKGPGVIGKQPLLMPGESFEYFSFCKLETNFGTMEGTYEMVDANKNKFNIEIARFFLSENLREFEANLFKRGQIVKHKLYDYSGVIADYDMYFLNDEKWYESNKTKPPKNKPWYYVLANNTNTVHYVSQVNLEPDEELLDVEHPLIEIFFNGIDVNGRYIRNDRTWKDLQ